MGEYYDVDIVVYGWPAEAIVPGETYRDQSWNDELALDALERDPLLGAVARAMRAADWEEDAAIEFDAGTLRVSCEHNYGLASIGGGEPSRDVLSALVGAGLPFYACDAGNDTCAPAFAAWCPAWSSESAIARPDGCPAIRTGPADSSGDPVLDTPHWRMLVSGGVAAIADYFDTRDAVARAAKGGT